MNASQDVSEMHKVHFAIHILNEIRGLAIQATSKTFNDSVSLFFLTIMARLAVMVDMLLNI